MAIAIVNYGIGNLFSIYNALDRVNGNPVMVTEPEGLFDAEGIIVPGVGAFGRCMEKLEVFEEALNELSDDGVPMLGICIGMQVLFERSEESPGRGFEWFGGDVKRLPEGVLVPHMGWNNLNILRDLEIFDGIPDGSFFYFVHSYHCVPLDKSIIAATTDYAIELAAAVSDDNINAVQFHPEKSGQMGLKILENFVRSTKC